MKYVMYVYTRAGIFVIWMNIRVLYVFMTCVYAHTRERARTQAHALLCVSIFHVRTHIFVPTFVCIAGLRRADTASLDLTVLNPVLGDGQVIG